MKTAYILILLGGICFVISALLINFKVAAMGIGGAYIALGAYLGLKGE